MIATKYTSLQNFMSLSYIISLTCVLFFMSLYALSWQQIIKRMPISDAYMFKGTSIVFVLLLSAWLFDEIITLQNVVGSFIIILGIALFAKADKEVEA